MLRDVMGGAARLSAGIWREVANVIDPQSQEEATTDAPGEAAPNDAAPEGVLVPVDTWTRVLDQLSNLHQAGQDLAEARERAARAETESVFLREQLAELRSRQRPESRAKPKPADEAASPESPSEPAEPRSQSARGRVLDARRWMSTWLRPDQGEE